MTPKNNSDPIGDLHTTVEEDLREVEEVMERLDDLSTAMDFVERRADNIMEELQLLLHLNQEIRQELATQRILTTPDVETLK